MTEKTEKSSYSIAVPVAEQLSEKLQIDGDAKDLIASLLLTAFSKDTPTPHQLFALLVVAKQYGLNPWTKEIYAFPDKSGGIVPVVGVDGWIRIVNEHPQFDGIEFESVSDDGDIGIRCSIYRKDRTRPVVITEYLVENKRGSPMWTQMPRRMLRHRALMQCARLAFGFAGIYAEDEAHEISNDEWPTADVVGEEESLMPKSKKKASKKTKEDDDITDVESIVVEDVEEVFVEDVVEDEPPEDWFDEPERDIPDPRKQKLPPKAEPPAPPKPKPKPVAEDSPPATKGEKTYLIASAGDRLDEALKTVGATMETLTKAQFNEVRVVVGQYK